MALDETLAMLNTLAIGGPVSSDARNISRHHILSMGVASLMTYLYPRFIAVHDLTSDVAFPDSVSGELVLPTPMPASYLWMEPDGAYLAGEILYCP